MLVQNPEGMRLQENVDVDGNKMKMYLEEIGWEGVDWIYLALDRGQWRAVMNFRVP
jgi:hypothetical protein